MDKELGAIILVLLASIHLGNCQQQTYNYTDNCTKIIVNITVDIVYPQTDGKNGTANISASNFSKENPRISCESTTLNIAWMRGLYSLTLNFAENNRTWNISSMQFEYTTNSTDLPDAKISGDTVRTDTTGITNIDLGDSYKCIDGSTYEMASSVSTVKLTLTDLQVQVFNFSKPTEFGEAKECSNLPFHIDLFESCMHVAVVVQNISITHPNSTLANAFEAGAMVYDSHCGSQGNSRTANITVEWESEDVHYYLTFSFSANFKRGKQGWNIGVMTFQYACDDEESPVLYFSKDFTEDYSNDRISLTRSYKCDRTESFEFTSGSSNYTATLSVSNLQLQAFEFSDPTNKTFGSGMPGDVIN